uniref:hypothetical protein n=1 Tax=Pseudonocardia sp. CA-138482 TaxID=3240023 RepID=UPI003F494D2F
MSERVPALRLLQGEKAVPVEEPAFYFELPCMDGRLHFLPATDAVSRYKERAGNLRGPYKMICGEQRNPAAVMGGCVSLGRCALCVTERNKIEPRPKPHGEPATLMRHLANWLSGRGRCTPPDSRP